MNKRGQVFLIAALIVVGLIIGLARITNQGTVNEEPEAFFDLGDEISFETKRVLDYGIINGDLNVDQLASQLLENYTENIAKNDVAFIYGNPDTNIYAYYYDLTSVRAISIYNGVTQTLQIASGKQIEVQHFPLSKTARIKIDGVDYTFDLKPGQNFYFVLSREENDEKFVTIE